MPNRNRRQPYRYQSRRPKPSGRLLRLAIVGLLGLLLLALAGGALWGIYHLGKPMVQALLPHQEEGSEKIEALLSQDFGLSQAPSLLYEQNQEALALAPIYGNRLLPIIPAREDAPLKNQLEQLFSSYADRFKAHFYYYNPQDGSYVAINGYAPVPAASVIKVPILLDYLMSLDESVITLDTPLLYADFHRAGGAGILQYSSAGQDFPANDVAAQMIRISDNTCTNMMISALGGTDLVNQRLAKMGLVHTRIRNWLPDLSGTNTVSPYEMATILYNIDQGPLLSRLTRHNGVGILLSTHNRRLLVNPLPEEVKVAHKTGDIGTALGDSGIVYLPDGRRYIISVQVERPYNDYTARDIIQRASRMIYDHVASQESSTLATRI